MVEDIEADSAKREQEQNQQYSVNQYYENILGE
jgi:hypothetical protein